MVSIKIFTLVGLFVLFDVEATSSPTTREPSLQAYGLPKRILASDGYIERINLGNAITKIDTHPGDPTGKQKKSTLKRGGGIDAALEILHLDSSAENERDRRSVENENLPNNADDLQTEETKVFRPLFVYRQQIAKRQKIQKEKNQARNTKSWYPNNKNSLYYYPQSG